MSINDDAVMFRCPVCGLEVGTDEIPCEPECGQKCGVTLLKEAFIDGMIAMAMTKRDGHAQEFKSLCRRYMR